MRLGWDGKRRMAPQTMTVNRTVTRPYSKMKRLLAEAAKRRGALTTSSAVAAAIGLSRSRVTQLFGSAREHCGVVVKAETVGLICAAFTSDGVACDVDWLYLDYDDFADRLGTARTQKSEKFIDDGAHDWERRERAVLRDLVELRLHPPRAGNEVKDSYYVDATLLFGTAVCDYDPENGEEPRVVLIALRDARLAIGSDSYSPLQGSMIGERIESDNFRRVAGGIEITGPATTLKGDPIGDYHLAVIAATNASDEPFKVTVAVHRRSFVVAEDPCAGLTVNVPVDNKQIILNHFIYKHCSKDEAGRAIVAQATMKRRSRDRDAPP
jgi:hypothetical protein